MVLPYTLVIEFDRHIGVVEEGLVQKGQEDWIPPPQVHPLELRDWGFPAQLGQPFDTVGGEPRELPGVDPCLQQKGDFLERLNDLRRRVGRGFAAEPVEQGTAGLGIGLEEAVQPGVLVGRHEWGQTPLRFVVRLLACGGNEPFQPREPGAHNVFSAELVTGELEQQRRLVML
jgi:hypothetical protein